MKPFISKTWPVALACLCAGAIAGGAGIAAASAGGKSKPGVSPFLVHHFALLRHWHVRNFSARATADAYPAAMKLLNNMADPNDPDNQREGLDVAATQQVSTPNGPVWVVPGSAGVCVITSLVAHTAGAGCELNSTLARSGQQSVLVTSTDVQTGVETLYGIVPNGVSALQLASTTAPSSSAPVVDNAVIASVSHLRRLADGFPDVTLEH